MTPREIKATKEVNGPLFHDDNAEREEERDYEDDEDEDEEDDWADGEVTQRPTWELKGSGGELLERTDIRNFNYDVIVDFVNQGG